MDLWPALRRRLSAVRAATEFTPTRRLALALALASPLFLLSGWTAGDWLGRLVVLGIFAAAVVDVAMLPRRDDISVRRDFPESVGVGDRVDGRYHITSQWDRTLWATLFDALPQKHLTSEHRFDESPLPAGGTLEHS